MIDNSSAQHSETVVSLLVPVYNVEKYVEQCARSIFGQTYPNLEIIFVVDEIKLYALVLEFEQAAILIAPCQRNGYRTDERKFFSVFCGEIFIKRQNHTGFHRTQFVECARKRADNLPESARPRERPCLRRGKKNVLDLIFRRFYGVFCVFGIFL